MSKPSTSLKPVTKSGNILNRINTDEKTVTQSNFSSTKFKSAFKPAQAKPTGFEVPKNRNLNVGFGPNNIGNKQVMGINQYKKTNHTDKTKPEKYESKEINLEVKAKVLNSITKKDPESICETSNSTALNITEGKLLIPKETKDIKEVKEVLEVKIIKELYKPKETKETKEIKEVKIMVNTSKPDEITRITDKKREALGLYDKISKLENRLIVKRKVSQLFYSLDT